MLEYEAVRPIVAPPLNTTHRYGEIFFKAPNSKSDMERKSLLLLLIPLYMVYFGINLLTNIVPQILDVLERDSFLEIVIIFSGMGATILAAVFSVLFGILWARKIILGEDTGVI